MRLKRPALSTLISFLLGAGWGIALMGALGMFFSLFHTSFFLAFLSAIMGAIPGLLMVVFLEHLLLKSEVLEQMKHQTHLLQKISDQHL